MSGILYCVDTRSSRILAHHAACTLLARYMQLLYLISFWFRMFLSRAGTVPPDTLYPYPTLIAASILGLRTLSRLLPITPSRPMQSDYLYRMFLAGQQACPQRLSAHSSAISGGSAILFPSGFILSCRCVPANWSVPSGRSYITSHYRPQAVQSLPLLR